MTIMDFTFFIDIDAAFAPDESKSNHWVSDLPLSLPRMIDDN